MAARPFALDAYAARSCPVKVQHRFDPDPRVVPGPVDEALAELFAGGIAFEQAVTHELTDRCPDSLLDRRGLEAPADALVARTAEAMARGTGVILGGWLPVDVAGHRSGRPDLLVRGPAAASGAPGYHPVEVKRHLMCERRAGRRSPAHVTVSTLTHPGHARSADLAETTLRYRNRDGDLIQLAHYWHLLAAAGHAADGPRRAGVVGTDRYDLGGAEPELGVVWVDLDAPEVRTFSRSSDTGWALRSPMERYDHEHGFRVAVAEAALDPQAAPLVQPIRTRECDRCVWWESCRPRMHVDDLSLRIAKAPLDIREIQVLRSLGVRTVGDLTHADLDALLPRYLPEVRHRSGAEERLRLTARRALLVEQGVRLERVTSGPVPLPPADVEIDFDIETAADERVYLWGWLVDDRRSPADPSRVATPAPFTAHAAWSDLDDAGEIALARRALGWLKDLADHPAVGTLRVYHYSEYELVRMRQLHARSGDPLLAWGLEFAADHFVDLFDTVRDHWFGLEGLGLKVVAHEGAGFSWRDADPGGLNSQRWFDEAVHAPDEAARRAARTRVLEYNEDDVRATHAVRGWIRAEHGGASGPAPR